MGDISISILPIHVGELINDVEKQLEKPGFFEKQVRAFLNSTSIQTSLKQLRSDVVFAVNKLPWSGENQNRMLKELAGKIYPEKGVHTFTKLTRTLVLAAVVYLCLRYKSENFINQEAQVYVNKIQEWSGEERFRVKHKVGAGSEARLYSYYQFIVCWLSIVPEGNVVAMNEVVGGCAFLAQLSPASAGGTLGDKMKKRQEIFAKEAQRLGVKLRKDCKFNYDLGTEGQLQQQKQESNTPNEDNSSPDVVPIPIESKRKGAQTRTKLKPGEKRVRRKGQTTTSTVVKARTKKPVGTDSSLSATMVVTESSAANDADVSSSGGDEGHRKRARTSLIPFGYSVTDSPSDAILGTSSSSIAAPLSPWSQFRRDNPRPPLKHHPLPAIPAVPAAQSSGSGSDNSTTGIISDENSSSRGHRTDSDPNSDAGTRGSNSSDRRSSGAFSLSEFESN